MDAHVRPADESELLEVIAGLVHERTPATVVGADTKRGLGRPVNAGVTLDATGIAGIRNYEPEELTFTAGAGTPLADIEEVLRSQQQELAFEPPDLGPLFGSEPGQATIGGTLACNLSGPRRFRSGTARDHFLGFRAVSGRAEAFKSGGHVVKNVSGYDLSKLLAGSFGTLAVLSEVTVKVLPRARHSATLLALAPDPASAGTVLARIHGSTLEPTGLTCLPEAILPRLGGLPRAPALAAIRLEGSRTSVTERLENLKSAIGMDTVVLDDPESRALWTRIRDVSPFAGSDEARERRVLWRISVPPARAVDIGTRVERRTGGTWLADGGGVIWMAPHKGLCAKDVREEAGAGGGHAMLVRASDADRVAVDPFPPQAPSLARIASRIKSGFDPEGILNPGRMVPA